jgi:hypothetical protein
MKKPKKSLRSPTIRKVEIPRTIREQITSQLFEQVIKENPTRGYGSKTLGDFSTDKRFVKEFLQMYMESIQRVFGVSVFKIKDRSIREIIDFLCLNKEKSVYFNNYEALSGAQPFTRWKHRR